MTAVVQAKCPNCQNVLRIPADWLNQPMRCKFCQNIFEARTRSADTPMPATAVLASPVARAAVPVGKPVAATGVAAGPPARPAMALTVEPEPLIASGKPRTRRGAGKGLLIAGCAVVLLIVAIPIAVGILAIAGLFGSASLLWFSIDNVGEPADKPLAHVDGKPKGKDFVAKDMIAKDTPKDGIAKPKKDKKGDKGSGLLPRRALLISVDNYLYLNSVHYGSPRSERYPGSSPAALAATFPNPPLRVPATQVFQLSDGSSQPHPTELSVLKAAIQDFLDTSRAQDRIIVLFAGHGTEIDKDAYLIPMSGRKEDPDTLLPLAWVYEQLGKCKAREKVLVLDLFRFPPALGFELPGAGASDEGEMGEIFDKALQQPPAGVQVWSSCIKGQRSLEFEGGSVFLQALNNALQPGPTMTGFVDGSSALPFDKAFVDKVNKLIKEQVGPLKFEQTSRMTGGAPADGAPYDPSEPLAPPITLKQPVVPGGKSASYAEINSILDEIKLVPPTRRTRSGEDRLLQAFNLPPFPAKVIVSYKADDYNFISDLRKRYKDDPKKLIEKHPMRAVVLDAIDVLHNSDKITIRESLNGPIDPKQKTAFLNEQRAPGEMIFELEQVLGQMKTVAAEERDKESSKRWLANFDYTMARLKARLVYIYEYSFILGQIRLDALPTLEGGQDGWRVGSRKKIQVTEPKAKIYAKEVQNAWRDIQKNYPDTPWAVLAYRESLVTLGLEWRAKKE